MSFHWFLAPSRLRHAGLSLSLAMVLSGVQAQTLAQTDAIQPAPTVATPATSLLAHGSGGVLVSVQDVHSELQRAPEPTRKAVLSKPDLLAQVINNILVRRTLAIEAERNNVLSDPAVASSLALARDRILSDAYLAQLDALATPNKAVVDKNVAEIYRANGERFDKPALTHARHILLDKAAPDALQKAQDILAQLRAGASFEEMAKTHSIDTGSGAKGGDLGFFPAGKMVQPFDDAVNALTKPGDLSGLVVSEFGYHIIRLEERREKSRQPLAEVREQLANEVVATIRNEARAQKLQKLSSDFVFDKEAIEALSKSATR